MFEDMINDYNMFEDTFSSSLFVWKHVYTMYEDIIQNSFTSCLKVCLHYLQMN